MALRCKKSTSSDFHLSNGISRVLLLCGRKGCSFVVVTKIGIIRVCKNFDSTLKTKLDIYLKVNTRLSRKLYWNSVVSDELKKSSTIKVCFKNVGPVCYFFTIFQTLTGLPFQSRNDEGFARRWHSEGRVGRQAQFCWIFSFSSMTAWSTIPWGAQIIAEVFGSTVQLLVQLLILSVVASANSLQDQFSSLKHRRRERYDSER